VGAVSLIHDRYEIVRQLGAGTYGAVYLVRDRRRGGQALALKLLSHDSQDATAERSELEALSTVQYPNLARLYDVGHGPEGLYFTCEYVEGSDLKRWASQHDFARVCTALAELLRTLILLHDRGWVHGDLKPSNVLVSHQGVLKLIDLGLATPVGQPSSAAEKSHATWAGTPGYCAPEVMSGEASTPAADVYAFAALAAEVLTGQRPFGEDPSTALEHQLHGRQLLNDAQLPRGLARLLEQCLARLPSERPKAAFLLERFVDITGLPLPIWNARAPLPQARLCGRDHELKRLRELFDGAEAGQPGALLIVGNSGLGKSRLLTEARLRMQRRRIACVEAASLGQLLSALVDTIRSDAASWELLAPRIRALLPPETPGRCGVTVDETGSLLKAALVDLSFASARIHPLALILDDLDSWVPAERRAIDALVHAIALQSDSKGECSAALVLLASCAPPLTRRDLPLGVVCELSSLSRDQVAAMGRSMLPGHTLAPQIIDALWDVSGGIPALVDDAVTTWVRGGQGARPALSDSDTLRTHARQRLADVTPVQRRALRLLALTPSLTSEVLQQLVPQLGRAELDQLIGLRLVREQRLEGQTRLTLAGQHLRRSLAAELKQPPVEHRRIAVALRDTAAPHAEIADQLARAGDATAAAEHYLAAAKGDLDVGGRWALSAARLGGTRWAHWPEAVRRATRSLVAVGRVSEALRELEQLHNQGVASESDCLWLAELAVSIGRPEHVLSVLDGIPGPQAEIIRAQAYWLSGNMEQVLECCRPLVPDPEALNLVGLVHYASGELGAALETLERADSATAETAGAEHLRMKVANNLALVHQRGGRPEQAQRWYRAASDRALRAGDPLRALNLRMNQATLCQLLAQYEHAIRIYREVIAGAQRLDEQRLEGQTRLNLTSLLLELGATEDAERELMQAERFEATPGLQLQLARAEVRLAKGQPDQAAALLQQADQQSAATDGSADAVELLLLRARLALEQGALKQAEQLAARARQRADLSTLEGLGLQARLEELRAAGRYPGDRLAEVADGLRAVVQRMRELRDRRRLWQALYELGQIEVRLGRPLDATYHLAKAKQELDRIADALPARLRQSWLARPTVREARATTHQRAEPAMGSAGTPKASNESNLLRLNLELGQVRDPEQLVHLTLRKAVELTCAQRGLLILVRDDVLQIAAAHNVDSKALEAGTEQYSKSLALSVLSSGEAILAVDAVDDDRFKRFASVRASQLRSVLCVPLRLWGSVIGVAYVDDRFRRGAFSQEHVQLLEAFGAQAAMALDTARLLEQTRERAEQLAEANRQVEALSAQLKQRFEQQSRELQESRALVQAQREQLSPPAAFEGVVGSSPQMRQVMQLVHRCAAVDIPVYIYGESGTGKELVARAIHRASSRADAPIVTLNCGSLGADLLASELFGHVRGAFTGAVRDHPGLLRVAEGGTLFLDEVTELAHAVQVQLLRVLQSGEFRPVGSGQTLAADVRIISAGNADIEREVQAGRFREDLAYRLNVIRLDLPPLRQRRQDIPALVHHFLGDTPIEPDALRLLTDQRWPGNVRELANELTRARALADGVVRSRDLSPRVAAGQSATAIGSAAATLKERLALYERQLLEDALQESKGNVQQASERVGISRASFYRKMERYGL
jgi:DNA-binding NtrC family response regulator/tetratricopeptide (TPR) repeat protein